MSPTTVLLVLGAVLLGPLAGCTTFQPHDPNRAVSAPAVPIPETLWPARKTEALGELAAATPKQVFALVSDGRPVSSRVPPSIERLASQPLAQIAYAGVHGRGIIREIEYPSDAEAAANAPEHRAPDLTLRFISFSQRKDLPMDPRRNSSAERQFRAWVRHLAEIAAAGDGNSGSTGDGASGLRPTDPGTIRMLNEGTAIRVVAPTGKGPALGSIVYMSGLGSAKYEQPLMDELSRRGWWLVRIATPRVWWYESKPWYIASRADIPRVAENLAGVVDDLVAEPAYAAEAALDYLAQHHAEVPQSPLVMFGCSCGALAAPAVVARQPQKFDAAVLVGGGANLLQISQTSDLTDGGIRLAWPDDEPRGPWRNELFAQYLKYSRLDPYHTARFLRDKPTLLVEAIFDMTVPAENGRLLWERLGRPDRFEHIGEHRTLFLTLGGQSRRIADWLDDALAARRAERSVVQLLEHDTRPAGPSGRASVEAH